MPAPPADEGFTLGRKALKQVAQAIRDNERRIRSGGDEITRSPRVHRELCVILDEALGVATNSKTGATSADATVCNWSRTDNEYVETGRTLTVWNHSESITHAEDTFGTARMIDGHWWFFGDCDAMAAR